jgi:K(+)-stimulated pyrophosphate-energized sodium pump
VVGLVVTALIVVITEYYTGVGYRPVRSIAQASVTGHGTNVIQGLAVSLESTALPTIVIVAGIIVSFKARGPLRHRHRGDRDAGARRHGGGPRRLRPGDGQRGRHRRDGGLPKEVRKSTDALDAVGNTTKAVTKGYAIGSAGLGALVLFAAYTSDLNYFIARQTARLHDLPVLPRRDARLLPRQPLRGGGPPVRRPHPLPLRRHGHDGGGPRGGRRGGGGAPAVPEKPGIMEGTERPDYGRAVDMLTRAAIKEMIIPRSCPCWRRSSPTS